MTTSTPDTEELVDFLKQVRLFTDLPEESLEKLGSNLKTTEFPPAETIMREGAPGVSMYIIRTGLVEVRKKDPFTGIAFLVSQLGPGSAVGELSLLTGRARSATVNTLEATTVFSLTRADFRTLLIQYPEISLGMARVLAERIEEANKSVGIEFVNLSRNGSFDPKIVGMVPINILRQHKVLPIAMSRNSLSLAMVNPTSVVAIDDVRRYVKGVIIEPKICTEEDFTRFMSLEYPRLMKLKPDARRSTEPIRPPKPRKKSTPLETQSLEDLEAEILGGIELTTDDTEDLKPSETELQTLSGDAPIVRLANNVLALAIQKGASDIHIEPQEHGVRVRMRVDGVLQIESVLSRKIMLPLASRLKILSRLDIAERRMPQDGRISLKIDDRAIDIRVSTVPAKFGEKIVMRVLDKSTALLPLERLIDHPDISGKIQKLVKEPYGIIYVTGPTGSGKTTTLYSCLSTINEPGRNISTAEDPIEYDLEGINQIQTHKDIGLDFARILRAFLRQDPDVLLVGETRDPETAKTAVEAALTGHLVFTTLHTNDAPTAFTRLEEMGIEPFLTASSTLGVIAQRLARRICSNCKAEAEPDPAMTGFFGCSEKNLPKTFKGKGCVDCAGTGYKGRVGIYELLVMNDELRRAITAGAKTDEIRDCAVKNGMMPLQKYAEYLVREGVTTVEAVMAVVSISESAEDVEN